MSHVLGARKLCRALALVAMLPAASSVLTGGALSSARAEILDLSLPRTVIVGAPRGAAPSERLDPFRTGRARTQLPATLVELWRRPMSGNIDVPPVIDGADDILVVLNNPEIIKLGPDSRELWRARLGSASAQAPPTLLSDGTVAVVTAVGIAWGFTPSGSVRFSTALGIPRRDADTAPLALADGGLLVAAGNVLVEIDADGAVRARAALEDRTAGGAPMVTGEHAAGAVLEAPGGEGGALVTTLAGNVYRFRPPALPHKIGSFGGTTPRGAAVADERTLLAVVDGRRLVALDLPTGTTHVRTGGLAFDGPPTIGPGGLVLLGTQLGMLLGVDAAGNERAHVLLDKPSSASSGALSNVFAQVDLKPSPPLVVDASGRVAFVRGNGRMGVVSPTGRVEVAAEGLCPVPIAVVPAGERRVMVACHDGRLWMYGE
jgi:hypothetical protein